MKSSYDPASKLMRLELNDSEQIFRIYGPDYDVFVTTNAAAAAIPDWTPPTGHGYDGSGSGKPI
ncbi:MAG: hypothetical protein QM813_11590 [Verrucomicrobiota bacterium]